MYRTVVTICTTQWSLYVPHSGHYMYHQFNIQQFYVQPTQLYLCFVWISEQTATQTFDSYISDIYIYIYIYTHTHTHTHIYACVFV